jgi:2-iminobutanoate/2-iminopropanoate deaminase
MKKILNSKNAAPPIGPYSQAVEFNDLIFTSGQISLDSSGNITSGDIKGQTKQVLENIKFILTDNNSSLDNVLKTTVYLKDMNEFSLMNEVYSTFFGSSKPARSTVEVTRLPKDVRIEIDVIAFRN